MVLPFKWNPPAVLSHGTIYLVSSSNFWDCWWNPTVWPFKWNIFGRTFALYYLFLGILQKKKHKMEVIFMWYKITLPFGVSVNLRALTICIENPEIPGRIQMACFIPGEIFRKKSNTFRGITVFPLLPKRPKFSVPFVWITSARLHVERKRIIYRYFVNGTTQSRSCFWCQKKYPQYHFKEIFHRKFLTNVKLL